MNARLRLSLCEPLKRSFTTPVGANERTTVHSHPLSIGRMNAREAGTHVAEGEAMKRNAPATTATRSSKGRSKAAGAGSPTYLRRAYCNRTMNPLLGV